MEKTKYYLISYAYEKGFGNVFFKATLYLDIRSAERTIKKNNKCSGVVIITINEITKEQYEIDNI